MVKSVKSSETTGSGPRAAELVSALNGEWAKKREYNLNGLKKFESAQAILKSDPQVQIAVAKYIIESICGIAKREQARGRRDWFTARDFPWGAAYFLSSHLKRRLPIGEETLIEMFGQVADVGFISASQFEFLGSLVSALERHAAKESLSPKLRKVIESVLINLMGKGTCHRLWEADAADRYVVARIERILAEPLDLN